MSYMESGEHTKDKKTAMTVGELIQRLALFPRDKLIWIDGGPSDGIGPEWYRPSIRTMKNSKDLSIEPDMDVFNFDAVDADETN